MSETEVAKKPPAPLAHRQTEATPCGGIVQVAVMPDADGSHINSLIKLTPRGAIHALKTLVPLRVEAGELWQMDAWVKDQATGKYGSVTKTQITALGYDKLNQYAGITLHQPETLIDDDGKTRPNPYFHFDGPSLLYVRIRIMGLGINAVGNVVLHDNTLRFDVRNYLARDIWSKWTGRKKESPKAWGKPYPLNAIPDAVTNDPNKYLVPTPMGLVLAVDLNNKDVISMFGEHLQRVNFAERLARTICKRNILKTFFAQVTPQVQRNPQSGAPTWVVPIVAWPQVDRDFQSMSELAAQAKTGKIVMDGQAIDVDVVSDHETVDDPDEVDLAATGEADALEVGPAEEPSEQAPGIDIPDASMRSDADGEIANLRATIRKAWDGLPDEIADDRLAFYGFPDGMSQVADCSDREQLKHAANRLESEYLQHVQRTAKEKSQNQEKEL